MHVVARQSQVRQMSAAGMDIQPHSLTHQRLLALSHEEALREIAGSKKILESRLDKPACVFAYPFGRYNDALIAMVKGAGFEGGDTLQEIARVKGFGS